jgi:hypothetical protein
MDHAASKSPDGRALAADLPEALLEALERENPEVARGLRKAEYATGARYLRSQEAEDLTAEDYTWLWDFEYQGQKLNEQEIRAVLAVAKAGFSFTGLRNENNIERHIAKPIVQAALHEATKDEKYRWQISAHKMGRELASVMHSDIRDFITIDPATNRISLKDLEKLPREMTCAIQEIHETRTAQGTQVRVKLYDKLAAINTAAKVMNLFPKEVLSLEINGLEEKLAAALNRLEGPKTIEGQSEVVIDG